MTNKQIVDKWQIIIDSKVFDNLESVESSAVENINPSGTFKGIVAHKKMLNHQRLKILILPALLKELLLIRKC